MKPRYIATCVLVAALAMGCAQARLLSPQEAYAYCHQNTAGVALGMNPLGEEYATWMSYCNQAWTQQVMPGMAFAADTWQRQQMINQTQPVQQGFTCYQFGQAVRCQ